MTHRCQSPNHITTIICASRAHKCVVFLAKDMIRKYVGCLFFFGSNQCGQYNDGVGSITPCLNYTDQTAPFYLKDCPRSSDAYCIVSDGIRPRVCGAQCTLCTPIRADFVIFLFLSSFLFSIGHFQVISSF